MSADAVAETILASHGGGGNWAAALALAEETLSALESAGEEMCERILVYFFWRWADILGLQPDLAHCASCGTAPPETPFWYSVREGDMRCAACTSAGGDGTPADRGGLLLAGPGCRRWLAAINALSPALLNRYTLDGKSFREARALTMAILAEALGKRPASWDMI